MRRPRRKIDHMLIVDITPMIDVVFLLIIFFMTAAQFVRLTREDVDLPRERGEQQVEAEEAGLLINLMADGRLVVGGETVTLPALQLKVREEMARQAEDPAAFKLMIRADRGADSGQLNRLVSGLRQLGVGVARLATEVPPAVTQR